MTFLYANEKRYVWHKMANVNDAAAMSQVNIGNTFQTFSFTEFR
jgi:hypothetical protein